MTPWVTRLIVANVAVFALTLAAPDVMQPFILVPALILSRPWTMVTYMFLHGGIWHIFFNMLGLYFFGVRLEDFLGGRRFLLLYFISGISGALVSLLFTPYSQIIGASAGVFGVFLGFAYYWPRERIFIWGVIPVEARWLVAGMTVLALFGGFGGGSGIAHFAHLGGFLGGYIYLRSMGKGALHAPRRAIVLKQAQPSADDLQRWMSIRRDTLHEVNRDEFDRIMLKIQTSGVASLSDQERAFLDRFSSMG